MWAKLVGSLGKGGDDRKKGAFSAQRSVSSIDTERSSHIDDVDRLAKIDGYCSCMPYPKPLIILS